LTFRFEPHLAEEHLGSQKYTTVQRALGELVANAFDAHATTVDVSLTENDLGGLDHIVITDDGVGMTSATLGTRFVSVGVRPQDGNDPSRLGKFGVGRLAVHRIGAISEWQTVARDGNRFVRSTFRLEKGRTDYFPVTEEFFAVGRTGTSIRIFNLLDDAAPTTGALVNDLLGQFCAYLLANTDRKLSLNGQVLDICGMVESREVETLDVDSMSAKLDHILLKKSVEASRFSQQVIFSAKGRTVATHQPTTHRRQRTSGSSAVIASTRSSPRIASPLLTSTGDSPA